jgi:hypothetical protein
MIDHSQVRLPTGCWDDQEKARFGGLFIACVISLLTFKPPIRRTTGQSAPCVLP